MTSRTRKRIGLYGTAALAAGVLVWVSVFHWMGDSISENYKDAVAVDRGEVALTLRETGTVEARTSVDVRSKVSGKIKGLRVEEGQPVAEGQVLAVVEPSVEEALGLIERRKRADDLRKDLEQRERDVERLRMLHEQGFIARQALEEAELEHGNAKRSYELEKVWLEALEQEYQLPPGGGNPHGMLADHPVVSSMAGVVTAIPVKEGELVTSGTTGLAREGSLLMQIADVTEMDVSCTVSEVDVAKLHEGTAVSVYLPPEPEREFPGRVDRVSPSGVLDDKGLVRFELTVRLDEASHPLLRPGMSCTVDVSAERVEDALRIPVVAFREDEEDEAKTWVQMVPAEEDEEPEKRYVELGLRGDRFAEVLSGLKVGELILEHPSGGEGEEEEDAARRRRRRHRH
ncbi:MAG: efflux RND transporter periplasmic adaptor subunit [Acidobacteriota bacterium]|nr:MAG: efflux RND transporter periplasmic adaptor subunit [Acidobacteriota bacterium]